MNWGRGLAIFIGVFILSMLGMVYIAFQQENEMLEDNYYDKELAYQKVIDAKNNLTPFVKELLIADNKEDYMVTLPQAISDDISEGNIELIKLDDSKLDLSIPLNSQYTVIPKTNLARGYYRVRIKWVSSNSAYYYEVDKSF